MATGVTEPNIYGLRPFFGVYDFAFAVAPNSPGDGTHDVLFLCGEGLSRSTDGGSTWKAPPHVLHVDHHAVVFYPAEPPAERSPPSISAATGDWG